MTETVVDKIRRKGVDRPHLRVWTYADSEQSVKGKAYRLLARALGRISVQFDVWASRCELAEREARSDWMTERFAKANKPPRRGR
jgi:hypothetical protein